MHDSDYAQWNQNGLNRQAAVILRGAKIPFDPTRELAALVLIESAVAQGLVSVPTWEELDLLLAKLRADPRLAMSLMTESEPGVRMSWSLTPGLAEGAAEILEEIIASIRARESQ